MQRTIIAAVVAFALGLALGFSPARASFPRQLLLEVVAVDPGTGDVTLRDYGGKELNEWAAPAQLTLSNPDETFAIGEVYLIDISGPQ